MTKPDAPPESANAVERWQAFDETLAEVRTSLADMPSDALHALITEAMLDVRGRAE
jgi:hypothetical protein